MEVVRIKICGPQLSQRKKHFIAVELCLYVSLVTNVRK